MSMQNFPRIPKNTLRTPADQAKDAKNKNILLFCTIFRQTPSWGSEVREPSVHHKEERLPNNYNVPVTVNLPTVRLSSTLAKGQEFVVHSR